MRKLCSKNKKREKTFIDVPSELHTMILNFASDYEILMALNKFLIIFGGIEILVTAIDTKLSRAIQTITFFRVLNK